jgi:RES domain-containing protein
VRTVRLSSPLSAYRIADGRFDIRSGFGAALVGGRWNPVGVAVVYTAASYAGAILEKLVHTNTGRIPPTQVQVRLELPAGSSYAEYDSSELGDWLRDEVHTQLLGASWVDEGGFLALRVPSVVARPYEFNLLLNPMHPDFAQVVWTDPRPVEWDARLFPAPGQ